MEVKAMQKVFVMYKLKPGVKIEDYRKWSVSLDQKVTPFQPGCHRFEVYEIKGAEQGESPYQIVEDIDVESWEAWQKVVQSAGMKEVVTTWNDYGDASTLKVIYGNKIK
jgi:quinol monooxygenase YgiN